MKYIIYIYNTANTVNNSYNYYYINININIYCNNIVMI